MPSLLTVFLSISFIKLPCSFPSDFCQRSGWRLIFKGTKNYWSNYGAIYGKYHQQCPPISWYGDTCEYVLHFNYVKYLETIHYSDAGPGGGGMGATGPPYLADQLLTLFQPGRADYPYLLLLAPPMFFTFRHHCTPDQGEKRIYIFE